MELPVRLVKNPSVYIEADMEIVGQPVSEADRKFWTLQKVLGRSSFL